jgi:hypothetical protein
VLRQMRSNSRPGCSAVVGWIKRRLNDGGRGSVLLVVTLRLDLHTLSVNFESSVIWLKLLTGSFRNFEREFEPRRWT